MKRVGITGLVLVAAFALSALAASSASAEGLVSCVKLAPGDKGFYEDSLCTKEKTGGEYANVQLVPRTYLGGDLWCAKLPNAAKNSLWKTIECKEHSATGEYAKYLVLSGEAAKAEFKVLPLGRGFTGKSGTAVLKSSTVATVTCKEDTNTGEITSMDSVGKISVKFTGCKVKGSTSEECTIKSTNPVGGTGEIITHTLKGLLGTVKTSESQTEVGLLLEPETTKKFVTLGATSCAIETTITGEVAGEVNPVKTLTSMGLINFETANEKQGIKEIAVLSGVKKPALEAFGILTATEETSDETQFDGNTEIT